MSHRVVFACGGTGGHLYPAQSLARELKQEGVEVFFAGVGLKKSPYLSEEFSRISLTGASSKNILLSLLKNSKGIAEAVQELKRINPELIVGFGSYHSFPILAASRLKKVPLILFNADSVLGKVNSLFNKKALKILSPFPQRGVTAVKMPLGLRRYDRQEALAHYNLDPTLITLLVLGGSQGALSLNELFLESVKALPRNLRNIQVLHLTGIGKKEMEAKRIYNGLGIRSAVVPFEEDMGLAYSAADIVLSRSGAASVHELIEFEKPALLVPYPYETDRHQTKNGLYMNLAVGGGIVYQQSELTPKSLSNALLSLMLKREAMKRAILFFKERDSRICAKEVILKELLK